MEFFYFLFFYFLGKFVTKNRDFGNNTNFLHHFFVFMDGISPLFPRLRVALRPGSTTPHVIPKFWYIQRVYKMTIVVEDRKENGLKISFPLKFLCTF